MLVNKTLTQDLIRDPIHEVRKRKTGMKRNSAI